MQEKTYLKVVLLGKVNSGKTCLVTRYITRAFSEETPSVSQSKAQQSAFVLCYLSFSGCPFMVSTLNSGLASRNYASMRFSCSLILDPRSLLAIQKFNLYLRE